MPQAPAGAWVEGDASAHLKELLVGPLAPLSVPSPGGFGRTVDAVSTVGARFARGGAVEFRPDTAHILDIGRLERASCECLEADREVFRAVAPRAASPPRLAERPGGRARVRVVRLEVRRAR
jgi:hypothetical protein